MKLRFKFITLALVALMVGFSSCSSDDEGPTVDGDLKTVFLKISNGPDVRSESAPQGADDVSFASGHLYFTNRAQEIVKYYSISPAATSESNISIGEISAGTAITGLPAEVSGVHVVGNTKGLPQAGSIAGVKGHVLNVTSQKDIGLVNLYGEQITLTPDAPHSNKYSASVTLAPTVARIELAKIEAEAEEGGGIESFKVAGIFIDNYYLDAKVDGSIGTIVSNMADKGAFVDNSIQYPAELKPAIYDWYSPAMTSEAKAAAPKDDKVWGYNLFAGNSVPRMIIRLTDIEVAAGKEAIDGDRFITIKGFKQNGVSLTKLDAGKIYRMGAGTIKIKTTDIQETPNIETIDVAVTVTLAKWTVVDVTPDIEQ